ncbi:hypothetical protein RhiirC2_708339 [Rhizophagus irregularis]|uniref:Uncharacterized protein n=1 Tax=Rhizophagus irregularis TaxID=588596 RepID=A0A2N1NMQ5_9GLOM|nr:hypothetical protein RhiirC2_708339 [Rhizophagus irregularis]
MKYGVDSNDTKKIPPFVPEPVKIDDKDEELEQCITKIKRRMGIIDLTTGPGSGIHAERDAARELLVCYHMNTRKRKASAAFDDEFDYPYGIVTVLDWYFLIYTPERIYCSKADYHIDLTEDIVKTSTRC